MRVLVLLKQTPDTWGERELDLATGLVRREPSEAVLDEISERAAEAALLLKDADRSTEVVGVSMGPSFTRDAILKALSMGVDAGVHVLDDTLSGADLALTAATLASAIRETGFDLVIAGNESTDGRGGVLPAMLAEHLGVPHLTSLDSFELVDGTVHGARATGSGTMDVQAALPAVISVTERIAEPRFPNFKGIMGAKKKPMTVLAAPSVATVGRSVVTSTTARPARAAGTKIVDDGHAADRLADYLASAGLL